ncbi:MAG TPA: M48 family metalloprotease [Terriglobales bacterium]|nr:M48 family metalloprotease [Terriglobales bacterium]
MLEWLLAAGLGWAWAQGTGCGALPPYQAPAGTPELTAQQELWLSQAIRQEAVGGLDGVADPQLTAELQRVMARLTAELPRLGFPVEVHLLLSDQADAFDMAGGQVYVTRPLVSLMRNEDELAGVLAHELGHSYVHQEAETYAASVQRNWGVASYGAGQESFLRIYQRWITWGERHPEKSHGNDEAIQKEADATAIQLLRAAGYDPRGLPDLFDRLTGSKGARGNWFTNIFGITPPDAQRLRAMVAAAGAAGPGCGAVAPLMGEAAFQQWQGAVVAYQRPAGATALPGLARTIPLSPLHDNYYQLLFSPDGRTLAADDAGGVWVMSVHPLALLFHIAERGVEGQMFTPDSRAVVFNTTDGRVERWDIASHQRTLLRQVVPASPGCAFADPAPNADLLLCGRADGKLQLLDVATGAVRYQTQARSATGFDLAQNGRYLAIKEPGGGTVLDLKTLQPLALPGGLHALVNRRFSFVGPGDEAMGTNDASEKNWELVQFPSGKVVEQYHLGDAEIQGETSGPLVIVRPLNRHPAGVVNPVTGRMLFLSDTADVDGYGNLFAGETKGGAIVLVHYRPQGLGNVATLALPAAPLDGLLDAGASPDLRLLAASEAKRGAVWDLLSSGGAALPGFTRHAFSGDHLWTVRAPTGSLRDPVQFMDAVLGVGTVMEFNLAKGTRRQLPAQPVGHYAGLDGGQEVVWDMSKSGRTRLEVHDPASGRLLWQRPFAVRQTPEMKPLLGGGGWVFAYAPEWGEAKAAMKRDAAAETRLQAHKKTDRGAWLELVNPQTGKSERQWLLDPAPSMQAEWQMGGSFYISDGAHRTLAYDGQGQRQVAWFGDALAASPAAKVFVLRTRPRELKLYGADAAHARQTYRFPHAVVFAQFSGGGHRLLALTRNQTAYILALPAPGPAGR